MKVAKEDARRFLVTRQFLAPARLEWPSNLSAERRLVGAMASD
jgi:hypothetical protein